MMKKIFFIIWLLGFILICALKTPVKYYPFPDEAVIIQTHIFPGYGKILIGQFIRNHLIWLGYVLISYRLLSYYKKRR